MHLQNEKISAADTISTVPTAEKNKHHRIPSCRASLLEIAYEFIDDFDFLLFVTIDHMRLPLAFPHLVDGFPGLFINDIKSYSFSWTAPVVAIPGSPHFAAIHLSLSCEAQISASTAVIDKLDTIAIQLKIAKNSAAYRLLFIWWISIIWTITFMDVMKKPPPKKRFFQIMRKPAQTESFLPYVDKCCSYVRPMSFGQRLSMFH